jgi:integrase
MRDELVSLNEAARLLDTTPGNLRKKCNAGDLPGVKVKEGKREYWYLTPETLDALLGGKFGEYAQHLNKWLQEMEQGIHTPKRKPLNLTTLENHQYGLERFWRLLGLKPSIQDLSPANFQEMLLRLPVDRVKKKCFYSQKFQTYAALNSFYHYLIRNGLKSEADLAELRRLKPERVYTPRKTVCQENEFLRFVEANQHLEGRTEWDRAFMKTLIMLYALAGLRRNEALDLKIEDINFRTFTLIVVDGKGNKQRTVPISRDLENQLHEWIDNWRPEPKNKDGNYILLYVNGEKVKPKAINDRILRLARRAQIDITPHGLRRTCATLYENNGLAWSLLQKMLGHNDIKTTMGYLMTDEQKLVDSIREATLFRTAPPKAEEGERKPKPQPPVWTPL